MLLNLTFGKFPPPYSETIYLVKVYKHDTVFAYESASSVCMTQHRSQQRIKAACFELEQALENFEDDTESQKRVRQEAEKLKHIKETLSEIKKQLDELSN